MIVKLLRKRQMTHHIEENDSTTTPTNKLLPLSSKFCDNGLDSLNALTLNLLSFDSREHWRIIKEEVGLLLIPMHYLLSLASISWSVCGTCVGTSNSALPQHVWHAKSLSNLKLPLKPSDHVTVPPPIPIPAHTGQCREQCPDSFCTST